MPAGSDVAVVTGASEGIGRATAHALDTEGYQIGVLARSEEGLREVVREIDGHVRVYPTDLSDRNQIKETYDMVRDELGHIDVLVNCAGVVYREPVHTADVSEWEHEVQVNLLGVMELSHFVVENMLENGSGHVVNVSSLNARKAAPGASGYTASKFGVNGFSEALRQEVTKKGVRVTVVEPGAVDTNMQPEEVKDAMKLLDPEDVANSIIYAVNQPQHVCVNNIQIRPTDQEF